VLLTHLSPSLQAPYFDASFSMASGPDIMALPFIHEAVRIATKVQSCVVRMQLFELNHCGNEPTCNSIGNCAMTVAQLR
jgi:hypothetical protein